jgi:hypothetical protein
MREGDQYEHYKHKNWYEFEAIALPMDQPGQMFGRSHVWQADEVARYHEDTHDLKLYTNHAGDLFIEGDLPMVIYKPVEFVGSKAEPVYGTTYAREVDDFFAWVEHDEEWQPRFYNLSL